VLRIRVSGGERLEFAGNGTQFESSGRFRVGDSVIVRSGYMQREGFYLSCPRALFGTASNTSGLHQF